MRMQLKSSCLVRVCRAPLAAFLVLLLLTGCASDPTPVQRAESFRALANTVVDDLPIQEFVALRTAHLISIDSEKTTTTETDGHERIAKVRILGACTAVAIAHDGYLLTAAHCADKPLIVALPANSDGRRILTTARVVYQGKPHTLDQDIALIKVDQMLTSTFDFAPESAIRPDAQVLIAGHDVIRSRIDFSFAGGQLRRVRPIVSRELPIEILVHTTPLKPGDSGGPLLTPSGQLLGINIAAATLRGHPQSRDGISLRPDPGWIQSLIQADRASHPFNAVLTMDSLRPTAWLNSSSQPLSCGHAQ
jgi:S1-C subfamily serine protease